MRSTFVPNKNIVWVEDLDLPGKVSVTNDAENVDAFCLNWYGNHLIVYRNTEGYWDMLEHDSEKFTGFRSLGDTDEYVRNCCQYEDDGVISLN